MRVELTKSFAKSDLISTFVPARSFEMEEGLLRTILKNWGRANYVLLTGSWSLGTQTPNSDVDLLIIDRNYHSVSVEECFIDSYRFDLTKVGLYQFLPLLVSDSYANTPILTSMLKHGVVIVGQSHLVDQIRQMSLFYRRKNLLIGDFSRERGIHVQTLKFLKQLDDDNLQYLPILLSSVVSHIATMEAFLLGYSYTPLSCYSTIKHLLVENKGKIAFVQELSDILTLSATNPNKARCNLKEKLIGYKDIFSQRFFARTSPLWTYTYNYDIHQSPQFIISQVLRKYADLNCGFFIEGTGPLYNGQSVINFLFKGEDEPSLEKCIESLSSLGKEQCRSNFWILPFPELQGDSRLVEYAQSIQKVLFAKDITNTSLLSTITIILVYELLTRQESMRAVVYYLFQKHSVCKLTLCNENISQDRYYKSLLLSRKRILENYFGESITRICTSFAVLKDKLTISEQEQLQAQLVGEPVHIVAVASLIEFTLSLSGLSIREIIYHISKLNMLNYED